MVWGGGGWKPKRMCVIMCFEEGNLKMMHGADVGALSEENWRYIVAL